jgi:hypothetical protein
MDNILSWENLVDPRDIPNEIKNFNLLIKNCDYILEKLNIVEYQETKDIWKISDVPINETDLMLKNLTSILNKLTLDNYPLLISEIKNFQVIEEPIIMEKAVSRLISNIKTNQVYIEVYSKLVNDINGFNLWFYKKKNFINYLLSVLESEFFNIVSDQVITKENDVLNGIEDEDERYEEESYYKKQKKGIILLICSLYSKNMITNKIIEEIIRHLVNPINGEKIPNDTNLELLSIILKEINPKLISVNFWKNNYCNDIKKSLKYMLLDKRIKQRFKFLLESQVKCL